jgi:serine/threonine protein kinase
MATEPMIGRVLRDRYHIQRLLGRQTGRRAFLASDLQTGEPVVLKLLLFGPDFTWDDLKLFEREAEVLKSLDHPQIPQYLDYFQTETELGNGFACVQTYIEARSLQDWVQSGRTFSETELKEIAISLLKILNYIHTLNPPVIHRDLKPSNVLLGDPLRATRSGDSAGQVYLVDFGSVQTSLQDGTRTIVGTYGYMAPEQFGGRAVPASDLYSLGATLLYLSSGVHPADLEYDLELSPFDARTPLNQPFESWLKTLLEPRHRDRFQSAAAALKALHQPVSNLIPKPKESLYGQPARSKVTLHKTPTMFEFTIPSLEGWFALPLFTLVMGLITWKMNEIIPVVGLLVFGIQTGVLIFFTLLVLSKRLVSRQKVRLHRSHGLTVEHHLLAWKYASEHWEDEQFEILLTQPRPGFPRRLQLKPSAATPITFPKLSELEALWLAEELSQWSGQPIHFEEFSSEFLLWVGTVGEVVRPFSPGEQGEAIFSRDRVRGRLPVISDQYMSFAVGTSVRAVRALYQDGVSVLKVVKYDPP